MELRTKNNWMKMQPKGNTPPITIPKRKKSEKKYYLLIIWKENINSPLSKIALLKKLKVVEFHAATLTQGRI